VELDGQTLHVRRGPRRLPQGAPTSPAVTNLICLRLDRRLSGLAAKLGFTYTRYADDMTFSASGEAARLTGTLLKAVGEIVAAEGFTVHPDKTRIMRRHRRQEVTGLTVNERVGVPRDTLRRFRALLHGIEKTGPDGKAWGRGGNVLQAARGFAQFVAMVDGEAGKALVAKVDALSRRHGVSAPVAPQPLARWRQAQEKGAAPDAPAAQGKPGNGAAPPSSLDLLGTRRSTVPQPAPLAAVQAPPVTPAPAQSPAAQTAAPIPAQAPAAQTATPSPTPAATTQAATPAPAQTPPAQPLTPPPAQAPTAQTATPSPAPAAITQAATSAPAQTPSTQPLTPPPAQAQTPPTATSSPAPAATTQAATHTQAPQAQNIPSRPAPTQAAPEPFRPPLGQQSSPPEQRSGLPRGWWLIPLTAGIIASLAGLPLLWRIIAIAVSGLAALFYFRGNGRS
jgi:hypothetical protein